MRTFNHSLSQIHNHNSFLVVKCKTCLVMSLGELKLLVAIIGRYVQKFFCWEGGVTATLVLDFWCCLPRWTPTLACFVASDSPTVLHLPTSFQLGWQPSLLS